MSSGLTPGLPRTMTPASGGATAKTLMVQGTASSVGKSLLVAGLCRYFRNQGIRVVPFKSQNMALNSFATKQGHEIGRAQAVQAMAAGVEPTVDMNPILLKPTADTEAQVVVMGKAQGSLSAQGYHKRKRDYGQIVADCLTRLRSEYELVIIEGAGSPAEINLRDRDIVNMYVAELADAPVLLVGDIDRGGVFAAFVGTLALLEPSERARVAALVINKFRGDLSLFEDGKKMLADRADRPVLGVVPYMRDLGIADEDSTGLTERAEGSAPAQFSADQCVEVAVVMFPYLSNYDDVLPLEREPGVRVRFVGEPAELTHADLVILPGTKSTRADLMWMQKTGMAEAVLRHHAAGKPLLGICGGYQMLGRRIEDTAGAEGSPGVVDGLGLLPCATVFEEAKVTRQVRGELAASFLSAGKALSSSVSGYEIHMGQVVLDSDARPLVVNGELSEGCISRDAGCVGTLMHGILDHDGLRAALISGLRERKGLSANYEARAYHPEDAFDRVAGVLAAHLDMHGLHEIVGLPAPVQKA